MKNKALYASFMVLAQMFLVTVPLIAPAQIDARDFPVIQEKLKQLEAQKVAFLTNKLKLTTGEAQKFWPVYNEYEAKKAILQDEYRAKAPDQTDMLLLTDKEAIVIADNRLIHAQKLLDLQKEFHANMKKVLPPKKVLLFYEAEKQFKRILLQRLQDLKKTRY